MKFRDFLGFLGFLGFSVTGRLGVKNVTEEEEVIIHNIQVQVQLQIKTSILYQDLGVPVHTNLIKIIMGTCKHQSIA